ncbi:MAG: GNAT family N-acetyltransferase [Planctomycetota bacterium]
MLRPTPIISTERCNLRLFEESDIDNLYSIYSDNEVMRFLPGDYSRDVAERHVAKFAEVFDERGYTLWAVESSETVEIIGRVGLWPLKGTEEVELGYVIALSYWGRGIATEASKACLDYGFKKLELPFVVAITVAENLASLRVMEKLGFQFVRKDNYYDTDVLYHRLEC